MFTATNIWAVSMEYVIFCIVCSLLYDVWYVCITTSIIFFLLFFCLFVFVLGFCFGFTVFSLSVRRHSLAVCEFTEITVFACVSVRDVSFYCLLYFFLFKFYFVDFSTIFQVIDGFLTYFFSRLADDRPISLFFFSLFFDKIFSRLLGHLVFVIWILTIGKQVDSFTTKCI